MLLISIATPLMWIALFGKSFNPFSIAEQPGLPQQLAMIIQEAIQERIKSLFGTLDYFTYIASGMLVVFSLFQGSFGGVSLIFDKRLGYTTRLLVAPIWRPSIFIAKIIGSLFRITVLSALLLVVASIMGFKFREGITPLDFLAAWLVVMAFSTAITSMYLAIAAKANHQEVVFALANLVNLPMMFTSSAIFPVRQMPWWLQSVAEVNPLTYAVNLVRYHLIGAPIDDYMVHVAYLGAFTLLLTGISLYAATRSIEEA